MSSKADVIIELTAFLEYALSSASLRASTKRRRRFGRFDGYQM